MLNINPLNDSTISLLGVYQKKWKQIVLKNLENNIHSSLIHNKQKLEIVQFTTNKRKKISKLYYFIPTIKYYYSAIERKTPLTHATICVSTYLSTYLLSRTNYAYI